MSEKERTLGFSKKEKTSTERTKNLGAAAVASMALLFGCRSKQAAQETQVGAAADSSSVDTSKLGTDISDSPEKKELEVKLPSATLIIHRNSQRPTTDFEIKKIKNGTTPDQLMAELSGYLNTKNENTSGKGVNISFIPVARTKDTLTYQEGFEIPSADKRKPQLIPIDGAEMTLRFKTSDLMPIKFNDNQPSEIQSANGSLVAEVTIGQQLHKLLPLQEIREKAKVVFGQLYQEPPSDSLFRGGELVLVPDRRGGAKNNLFFAAYRFSGTEAILGEGKERIDYITPPVRDFDATTGEMVDSH